MTQKTEQRYRICGDNSGHDYFIKVQDVEAFERWVEAIDGDEFDYEGPEFNEFRIDGRFTFTDPRCN